jgi:hypothetical protein
MARCEVCTNDYDKTFTVIDAAGDRHVFDSLQCAIERIAPLCENCRSRIIGHGCELGGSMYCSAHCARSATQLELVRDRATLPRIRTTNGRSGPRRP